jgi:hypothetical protein
MSASRLGRSVWHSTLPGPHLHHQMWGGVCPLEKGAPGVSMNRGGLDLRDLEGSLPFSCPNLPDQSDSLTRPWVT